MNDKHDEIRKTEEPPTSILGIVGRLGPGLIIAGSIVGSGELIATTKTGAEAGFTLLWLIVIGCVIKVFAQVEFGRYSLVTGKTAMDGLAEVPGPRISGRGNWVIWYWFLVFLATIGQVGGIVGGVGQALQISVPLTDAGRQFNRQTDIETQYTVSLGELKLARDRAAQGDERGKARVAELEPQIATLATEFVNDRLAVADDQLARLRDNDKHQAEFYDLALEIVRARIAAGMPPDEVFSETGEDIGEQSEEVVQLVPKLGRRTSRDHQMWAFVIALITAVVLVVGRYGFIQSFSTVLVASFTFITVVNVVMLQNNAYWAVTGSEFVGGMSFQIPSPPEGAMKSVGIATALATFGIIGVGANELIAYPYWCLEKGYARFTGPRDESEQWANRARGWMRVMRWDAWCSMVVYTFATLAFYLLGAAILSRTGLRPGGENMVRTLGVMYEPVFGATARWIFLFGAFAVLYSTFFVATASLARVVPDGLRVMGMGPRDEKSYRVWVRVFSGVFPFLCFFAYTTFSQPAVLVLLGGVMQGIMLPMLGGAALFFRYQRSDKRITPSLIWDLLLWISALGMLITGLWTIWSKVEPYLG